MVRSEDETETAPSRRTGLFPLDREVLPGTKVIKLKWRRLRSLPLSYARTVHRVLLRSPVDDYHSVESHRSSSIVHVNHLLACSLGSFVCLLSRDRDMRHRTSSWTLVLVLLAASSWRASSLNSDSGSWFQPTKGEVWPIPNLRVFKEDFYLLRPSNFDIRVSLGFYIFPLLRQSWGHMNLSGCLVQSECQICNC